MNGLLVLLFLTNFVKTVFILIVIYYALKIIGRIAIFSFVNHVQRSNSRYYQNYNNQQRRDGDVTVENRKSGKSTHTPSEGEYVDFEEVD